ncbi:ribonuclease R [Verrucomicrobiota bacterium]
MKQRSIRKRKTKVHRKKSRSSSNPSADQVTGILDVIRSGDGFLTEIDGRQDVFIPQRSLGTALPGDKITARIQMELRGRETAKVVRVIERARHDIVGTLKRTDKFLHVVPVDPAYNHNFYVPDSNDARINDRVVIRFTNWENKHVNPEAEIIEVIGPSDNASLDTLSIIRHYGFRDEFPADVMREAETASSSMNKPGKRLDLRDRHIITIDPKSARDFDDALSLSKDSHGNRVLGVHIADVSHFVKIGGALDKEARQRGTSVYLPDKVIPMLPEQLSNGICSLRPNEDRLAFSAFITFDQTGEVLSSKFTKSIIKSKCRLTYEEALTILGRKGAGHDETERLLKQISRLAQQLRKKRFALYALNFNIPECKIEIGTDGLIKDVKIVRDDISHQLVEECMIAANEAVARELSNRKFPFISRIHEPPSERKIEELSATLTDMGFTPGNLNKPRNLSAFLKTVKDHPLVHHVRVAVLRSMNRAVYSCSDKGHFGLAKKYYAHFTSPIRRYPDLTIHRQLSALVMSQKKGPYEKNELSGIAQASSLSEQAADEAERSLIEIKILRFLDGQLKKKKPRVYDAVVVKVMNFGMFVELIDLKAQGLVHVSAISDKYVVFGKNRGTLKAGKKVYRLGSRIKVFVCKVDFDNRRIDFALA